MNVDTIHAALGLPTSAGAMDMLGSQRSGIGALRNALTDPTVIDDTEMARWRATLETEIAAMEADPLRIPWQDGIPESLEASFLPYRERLEDSYDPMTSALEVGILRR